MQAEGQGDRYAYLKANIKPAAKLLGIVRGCLAEPAAAPRAFRGS